MQSDLHYCGLVAEREAPCIAIAKILNSATCHQIPPTQKRKGINIKVIYKHLNTKYEEENDLQMNTKYQSAKDSSHAVNSNFQAHLNKKILYKFALAPNDCTTRFRKACP